MKTRMAELPCQLEGSMEVCDGHEDYIELTSHKVHNPQHLQRCDYGMKSNMHSSTASQQLAIDLAI